MDLFDWDDAKNQVNIAKHGIDFDDAIAIFLGATIDAVDERVDYGEIRIIALGETNGQVLAVVYTMRDDVCRIISARRARRDERTKYYAAVLERSQDRQD